MKELDRILSSIAQKIEGHPDLKQANARVCSGVAGNTDADRIAALYQQFKTLASLSEKR